MKKPSFTAASQPKPPQPETLEDATETIRHLQDRVASLQALIHHGEAIREAGAHLRILKTFTGQP